MANIYLRNSLIWQGSKLCYHSCPTIVKNARENDLAANFFVEEVVQHKDCCIHYEMQRSKIIYQDAQYKIRSLHYNPYHCFPYQVESVMDNSLLQLSSFLFPCMLPVPI